MSDENFAPQILGSISVEDAVQRARLAQLHRVKEEVFGDALTEEGVTDLFADPPNHGDDPTLCSVKKKRFGKRLLIGYAPMVKVMLLASLAAGLANRELNRRTPRLAVTLPITGERVQAHVPPVSLGPALAIRIPLKGAITLPEFARGGVMDERQIDIVRAIVSEHGCLAISGLVGSGKTTLQRAINEEPAIKYGRPVYVGDTVEYLPTARDGLVLATSEECDPPVTMADLIGDGLREDATHLIPYEVRRGDARNMVEAWTTGHSGNCTLHTGTVRLACDRVAQMVGQGGIRMDTLQMRWIASAVNFVVQIRVTDVPGEDRVDRRVTDIVAVKGYDEQRGFLMTRVRDAGDVVAFMRERGGMLDEIGEDRTMR